MFILHLPHILIRMSIFIYISSIFKITKVYSWKIWFIYLHGSKHKYVFQNAFSYVFIKLSNN